jgi:hypothetical protein
MARGALLSPYYLSKYHDPAVKLFWGAKMGDELGTEFSAACNKLRRVLQEKTGDGRLRDLEVWLDYDGKSVFIAALWSDDEASVAVRFQLSVPISAAEFDPQMFIRAAKGSERATSRLAA